MVSRASHYGMDFVLDRCFASVNVEFSETTKVHFHLVELCTCFVKTPRGRRGVEAIRVLVVEAENIFGLG